MTGRQKILIFCFFYAVISSVLFFQNQLSANETNDLDKIIKNQSIQNEDKRAELRAFYTAPPVIPHKVESQDSRNCLTCHQNVTKLGDGRVAMQTPHPQFSNCLQCHVPSVPGGNKEVNNSWEGLEEPKRGDRWFVMSPPPMPHRIALRENCLSCHGPKNPNMKMRTPHPERTSCLQCHVPDYKKEF